MQQSSAKQCDSRMFLFLSPIVILLIGAIFSCFLSHFAVGASENNKWQQYFGALALILSPCNNDSYIQTKTIEIFSEFHDNDSYF